MGHRTRNHAPQLPTAPAKRNEPRSGGYRDEALTTTQPDAEVRQWLPRILPPRKRNAFPSGIYKRTDSAGKVHYQVKVRVRGHPTQSETFGRLTDAKRWQTQTTAAIRERRHFKSAEAEKHTVRDMCKRYIRDVLPGKAAGTVNAQGQQLGWWADELGTVTLADCTPALIAEARDKLIRKPSPRGDHTAPATVVRYLTALSHAFTSGGAITQIPSMRSSQRRRSISNGTPCSYAAMLRR